MEFLVVILPFFIVICLIYFVIFPHCIPVINVLITFSLKQLVSASWRGSLYLLGVFACLPLSLMIWILNLNGDIAVAVAMTALFFVTPFSILYYEIIAVARKINDRKIKEKLEDEKRRKTSEKIAEKLADLAISKSIDFISDGIEYAVELLGGSFGGFSYRKIKMQWKQEEENRMWQESIDEALPKVVNRKKRIYFHEIALGICFLILVSPVLLPDTPKTLANSDSETQSPTLELVEPSITPSIQPLTSLESKPPKVECDRLLTAVNSTNQIQTFLSSNKTISTYLSSVDLGNLEISALKKNTLDVIQINSTFAKSLSGLNLKDAQLLEIQSQLLDLSRSIYLAQYAKQRALQQLGDDSSINIANLLLQEYKRFNDRSQEFIGIYQSLTGDLNRLCG